MNDSNKYDFNPQKPPKTGIFKIKGFGLFAAIFWAFFLALALSNVLSPYFSQIISGLLSGIGPLFIGIVIAFIFYRLVDFIERVVLKNAFAKSPYKFGLKRTISIIIVILIIVAIFAIVISILVPKIIEVIQRLTAGSGDGGTQIYNNVVNEICNIVQRWFGAEVSQDTIKDLLNSVFEWFMDAVGYLNNLMELSINVISGMISFLMGVLLAILILKDKEKITKFFRRFTYAHFSKEKADELCVMTNNANKILFNYTICKLIEFALVFVSLGLTYVIMGLEFTWELSLIIGLFNFIPYFGIYIGSIVAILIILIFNGFNPALYMAIATFIIATIEFNVLLPFITSNRLKISALLIVGSIIIGGAMFGVAGMFFAPPIVALISVVVVGNMELKENHMKYVMELNKARELNRQEEQARLGVSKPEESATLKAENSEEVSSSDGVVLPKEENKIGEDTLNEQKKLDNISTTSNVKKRSATKNLEDEKQKSIQSSKKVNSKKDSLKQKTKQKTIDDEFAEIEKEDKKTLLSSTKSEDRHIRKTVKVSNSSTDTKVGVTRAKRQTGKKEFDDKKE